MKTLFISSIKCMMRNSAVLIWALAFPVVLSTMFWMMFPGMDDYFRTDPVDVCVVENANYENAPTFAAVINELSEGEDALLNVRHLEDEESARNECINGTAACYIAVDESGMPAMFVSPIASSGSQIDQSIVRALLDSYVQTYAGMQMLGEEAARDPLIIRQVAEAARAATGTAGAATGGEGAPQLANAVDFAALSAAFTLDKVHTVDSTSLHSPANGTVRYYYALLGMAALMGLNIALVMVMQLRANITRTGMRCQASALPPVRQLAAVLAAAWLCAFGCLLVAFAYMRVCVGIDFGGRDGLAVTALALCALMATMLGAVIGSVPRLPEGARIGLSTGIVCTLSLFAGLYGEPCMQFSDMMAQSAPWLQAMNPAVQAANSFYSLTYYDSLQPFFGCAAALLAMAAVFFAVAAFFMRRQRYARL